MNDFWRIFGVCALFWATLCSVEAHPAHAEEINRPFVPGFERFFSDLDDDAYLTAGGHLLLNELNCVACHAAPESLKDRFRGVEGPKLKGVGSRINDTAALHLLIRNPRVLKKATAMPSLFAGPGRDLAELDALFHFLASLKDEKPREPLFQGIPDRGQKIYHEVGCIACHIPDSEFRPDHLPVDFKLEKPALPSHPIQLAAYWDSNFLTRYLMEPDAHHPSGRMPNFGLGEQEAADLAAYLKAIPGWNNEPIPLPVPDLNLAEQGKQLFESKRCSACHDTGLKLNHVPAIPLMELRAETLGCLADEAQPGAVPFFYLGKTQRRALKLAIADLSRLAKGKESTMEQFSREMMQADCYACHSLDGRGGPEEAREPYFGVTSLYALDREEFWPPSLDTAKKLQAEELLSLFLGKRDTHYPRVKARMLVLPETEAKRWTDLLRRAE